MAYKRKYSLATTTTTTNITKICFWLGTGNKLFDFSIHDHSADVSINSTNAAAIKSVISRYINEATYFLVIVGAKTHKSAWVKWEIEKAVELKKRIVAVKTDRENTSPTALLGVGATWAMSFTYDAISKAIDNA